MGAYPALRRFTPGEYLKFERAAETRSEYVDGQIFAMAGGTLLHDRIVMNASRFLFRQLEGGKCEVQSANLRIAVSKRGPYFYPDLSIICGEPQLLDTKRDCVLNPSLVVEVLSKSTRKYDREVKVGRYQQIATMRHVLLPSQTAAFVEHHFRKNGGEWEFETISDLGSVIEIASLGVALPMAELYRGCSAQIQSIT